MIEQTWWNTPWIAVYLTHGRAVMVGLILLMWLGAAVVVGFGLGRRHG